MNSLVQDKLNEGYMHYVLYQNAASLINMKMLLNYLIIQEQIEHQDLLMWLMHMNKHIFLGHFKISSH